MRSFVSNISTYSKIYNPNFIIIPQNGQDLAILSDSNIAIDYISKIDAQAREDMYYGYNKDDETTPTDISNEWEKQLDIIKSYNKTILTIDYCSSSIKMDDAYSKNNTKGYNSFSADQRNLNNIPTHTINNENSLDILSIKDAKNFLYLINGENFTTKRALIDAIKNTNYDAIVMDLNQNEEIFSASEINELKVKKMELVG
jgi:cysteinyl-tRNA synthetase